MNTTILQVPMEKSFKIKASKAAENLGFSSLQEAVRVFLAQLPTQTVNISFTHPPVQLSPKAATRYDKMSKDISSGKVNTIGVDTVEEMMAYLHS